MPKTYNIFNKEIKKMNKTDNIISYYHLKK